MPIPKWLRSGDTQRCRVSASKEMSPHQQHPDGMTMTSSRLGQDVAVIL